MRQKNENRGGTDRFVDRGEQRILRWLKRYPFQRAQDLVLALGPWEGRGAVYRRLERLKSLRLIETLCLGASTTTGGKALYHLSFAGLQACAAWEPEPPASPLILPAEREKLIRLLPRVPVWLLLQDVLNGLVSDAPIALTCAGYRAEMVRWNWLRDYTHPFVIQKPGENVLSLRLDGVLAFHLRFPSFVRWPASVWQTLFLLHCPLDEPGLLRQRLDRLARWNEAAARRPVPLPTPPVLILATSAHQAELWQRAAAQVTARLRLELPPGALASIPERKQALQDGWHLPWRTLGTDRPCRLQDLLPPDGSLPFPELLELPRSAIGQVESSSRVREADQTGRVPPLMGKHLFDLATIAATRRVHTSRPGSGIANDYRLASIALAPRQWEFLTHIFAHPLLSCDELGLLLNLHTKSVHLLLADLRAAGYLLCVETAAGRRWHLSEAGLRLLARAACCHIQRLVRPPVGAGLPLQQRGLAGLLHQARHTAGVYSFFAHLQKALTSVPAAYLRWWETGALCERVFLYREKTYHFKPDALACVQIGGRSLRFWLEWDRGTMGVRDLERKCATYAAYLTSREWASAGMPLPLLVCVVPDIAQERRLHRVARALLAHLSMLRLFTTTYGLLMTQGILAPIWQQVLWPPQDASAEQRPRVPLFPPA